MKYEIYHNGTDIIVESWQTEPDQLLYVTGLNTKGNYSQGTILMYPEDIKAIYKQLVFLGMFDEQ